MALRKGVEKVALPSGDIRYEVRVRLARTDGTRRQARRRFTTATLAGEYLDTSGRSCRLIAAKSPPLSKKSFGTNPQLSTTFDVTPKT